MKCEKKKKKTLDIKTHDENKAQATNVHYNRD